MTLKISHYSPFFQLLQGAGEVRRAPVARRGHHERHQRLIDQGPGQETAEEAEEDEQEQQQQQQGSQRGWRRLDVEGPG